LARLDQALGAQCRNRLAQHGAADAESRRQFLLGRQPRAGREAAAFDLGGKTFNDLAGAFARRTERQE
jgi:hypothetical protein